MVVATTPTPRLTNFYCLVWRGTIGSPVTLNDRVTLPNGETRTQLRNMTDMELTRLHVNGGYYRVYDILPIYDDATQTIDGPFTQLADGKVQRTWTVRPMTPAEVSARQAQLARDLAAAKAAKKREIAAERWTAIESGVQLPDGTKLHTDAISQGMITGGAFAALVKTIDTNALPAGVKEMLPMIPDQVNWKGVDDWAELTNEQIMQGAVIARVHYQQCYDRNRALDAAIDLCTTVAEVNAIQW